MKRATQKEDLNFLAGVFFGAPLAALLMLGTACPPKGPDVPPSQVDGTNWEAKGSCVAYRTARQLQCDVENRTRAEIDAFRAGVQLAVDCTDGGWIMFLPRSNDGGAE